MRTIGFFLSVFLSCAVSAAPKADLWALWQASNESSTEVVDHGAWQQILDRYLDAKHASGVNRFDYAAVTADDKTALDSYIRQLQSIDPRRLRRDEQQAYWINLYNAHTVQVVLAAYPVKSILKVDGGIFSRGPWNKKRLNIAGQAVSLNDIEHRILRPIWKDPRIHFAVNCASIGCPNLLASVFTAANAEGLLTQAAQEYLSHSRGLNFNGNTLRLSKIFDWYRLDFAMSERDLLKALLPYLPVETAKKLKGFNGDIEYHYDWSLNGP